MQYSSGVIECVRDVTEVVGLVDGLVLVHRESEWSNGGKLGGDFRCELRHAIWLADKLDLAADDALPDLDHEASPDHFLIDVRGGERGEPINVNVLNRRDRTAAHGRTYSLSGMSPETARQLARDLRECVQLESAR
jgi:hypothetical protein